MKKRKSLENTRFLSIEVCVSPLELQRIKDNLANSTCHNLSQYVRKCSLGDPVTVYYRNKSLDEFVGEIIRLRKELQETRQHFSKEKEDQALELITAIKQTINQLADYVRENFDKS
jgi:hypothetical protein